MSYLLPIALLALLNMCRGVGELPRWAYFPLVGLVAFLVHPSWVFAAFWIAYALAFQVFSWGHGLQIVSRKPMLVDWSRSDFRIVRLVKGNKLGYWAIRSMYGYPGIVAMTCWYGEPWILAIGLLPQTIGLFGYLVGQLTQSKNAWRLVEMYIGVVYGCMMLLTKGLL